MLGAPVGVDGTLIQLLMLAKEFKSGSFVVSNLTWYQVTAILELRKLLRQVQRQYGVGGGVIGFFCCADDSDIVR